MESTQSKPAIKGILGLWIGLLIVWFPFAMLSGMAFDAGRSPAAYRYVWSVWTYPLSILIGFLFRKSFPLISWLPLLNIISAATC